MNTLYLLSRDRVRYMPDQPLPISLAEALQREWRGQGLIMPTTILGEPVRVVDLRPPEPMVAVVDLDRLPVEAI